MDDLHRAIRDHVLADHLDPMSSGLAPNLRHRQALTDASKYFRDAFHNINQGLPLEVIVLDLNSGLEALGDIIGETTNEDVIEKIFRDFCVGK